MKPRIPGLTDFGKWIGGIEMFIYSQPSRFLTP
jgi:hypothetical protein